MSKPIVEVEHLSVHYQGQKVLKDLTFSVRQGDIVALVGPNGSGKTTLIRSILGLIPYDGRILVDGKPVRASLEKIGYVPQKLDFDRTIPMTVGEFLKISYPNVLPRKIKHVLLEVDMHHKEHALIGTLSGGEFQRTLIARALVNDPSLLLLDEATSEVDLAGEKSFYDIVAHLKQIHETTVILISHEINMVYKFSDQIICLNRELICFGKPKDAITQEVLEKLYGKDVRFQIHEH